jgi:hypothetical protein
VTDTKQLASSPRPAHDVAQHPKASQMRHDSGCGIVEVSSFLGSSKQNRMVKEALSADFADQVTPAHARCLYRSFVQTMSHFEATYTRMLHFIGHCIRFILTAL